MEWKCHSLQLSKILGTENWGIPWCH